MRFEIFSTEPPSDDFMDAVRDGGGIRRTCEACGRECFEDDESAGDWETGELEGLRKRAEERPNECVAMDRVEAGSIGGKDIVVNCPCNFLRKYEDFIWSHRHIAAKYIAKRAKQRAEAACEDEAEAEFMAENVEQMDKAVDESGDEVKKEEVDENMDAETLKAIASAAQ